MTVSFPSANAAADALSTKSTKGITRAANILTPPAPGRVATGCQGNRIEIVKGRHRGSLIVVMMFPMVDLAPTSLLPGAVRRHLCAIPAEAGAAKTPVMRLRPVIEPQHAVLAGAPADEGKIGVGQKVRDCFGDGSQEL